MVRSIRHAPLFLSVSALLAAGAPLDAQGVQGGGAVVVRRAAQSASLEGELRRLQQQADSLAVLYNESEDLGEARRRAIGDELDRTVARIGALSRRLGEGDARRMTTMRVQVAPMVDEREATAMANALRQSQLTQVAMPRGWLGIVVSGTAREPRIENGELIIRYLMHPEIVSVEPSSPAARAGLVRTDTLLAYNGIDVKDRDISLTSLLKPNSRVLVRVRREGKTKDVPVVIADVPSRIRLRSEVSLAPRAVRGGGGMTETLVFPRAAMPPSATPRMAPMPPMGALAATPAAGPDAPGIARPPVPSTAMIFSYGFNSVAGAQLVAITEGLGRAIGVSRGVLVTQAPIGSLAHESGLRDGDVIARVEGEPVFTPGQVRERVQVAANDGESSIVLDVVRDRKPVKVTLRWNGGR